MAVRGKRAETPPNSSENAPRPSEASTALTPEQDFALKSQWKRTVLDARAVMKDAKTEYDRTKSVLRDTYKKIKAEVGAEGLEQVKLLVDLDTNEKTAERLKAEMERLIWAAQWANAFDGQQLELMSDLRPTDDRAYNDGKMDGLAGKSFNPRYGQGSLAYNRYQDGWNAGQDILAKGFKVLEKKPEDLGEPTPTKEGGDAEQGQPAA